MVFGVNLRCFWSVFFGFSLTACANGKSGFDTLFIMFAAHSHVRKLMKNMKKCCQNWKCALGFSGARFGAPFWRVLVILWRALGRHFGKKGRSERHPKNDAKNRSAEKFDKAREGPGDPERDPIRPYKPSFLEPRNLHGSWDCGL